MAEGRGDGAEDDAGGVRLWILIVAGMMSVP